MARTPRADSEQLRARIRQAAGELFAERGYAATSVQAVADRVGISKQSLLYHYSSKSDMKAAVYADLASHATQHMVGMIGKLSTDDPVEDALRLVGQMMNEQPHYSRMVFRELLSGEQAVLQLWDGASPWMKICAQAVREGQSKGLLRQDIDPEAIINLLSLLLLALYATSSNAVEVDPSRMHAEFARLVKRSLFLNPS